MVFVNGILTDEDSAKIQRQDLENILPREINKEPLYIRLGHNKPHIGGAGDIIQSAAQSFGNSVSDFDRDTILMQIHPQVSTRKILLLGHSQGTFYSNSIYQYLLENGVPKESIAVYNLATPASFVAGGGNYLTSSNDKLINGIRPLMAVAGALAPLPANITIPLPPNEVKEKTGGHHFGSSYLAGEPDRIVGDISQELGNLKAGASTVSEGCFTPPPKTIAHKTKAVAFAVADPVVQAIKTADIAVVNAIDGAASATGRALGIGIIITGKAIVYAAIVTGRAVVYAADVAANAIVAAAQKAAAAATYAAAQIRNVFATVNSAAGKEIAASQVAAVSPALLKISLPPTAPAPAKTTPTVVPTPPTPKTVAVVPPITPEAPATFAPPPVSPPPASPPVPLPSKSQMIVPLGSGLPLIGVSPGFGGGGGASAPSPVVEAPVSASVFVPLSVQTPLEGASFATSSVTFSGTTTPGYAVVASHSSATVATTADVDGNWLIALDLPDGTASVGVVATDSVGNTSDAITRTITVDTTPPVAPSPSISECSASLSAQFCLIPTTGASLAWPLVAGATHYAYVVNSAIATTTGTSVALSLATNATTTFSVAAYDAAGNAATSTAVNVYVATQPLIINEVAWAGTQASASDQWIEIKNVSPYEIDNLSFVALAAADGAPYIQLHINIIPGTTYIIERRAEATSATGDLITAFTEMSQTGEELLLLWGSGSATTTMDSTPAVSTCGGWCSGASDPPMTMERKTGTAGTSGESWQYGTNTDTPGATDASGNTIQGTPRAENSSGGEPPVWAVVN